MDDDGNSKFHNHALGNSEISFPTPLMTVEEVALFLRITPTTVRKMAGNGQLPAFKIGRSWRFPRMEIVQLGKLHGS